MDIAIFNYPTCEIDIIRGIDVDFVETFFGGDIELYLEDLESWLKRNRVSSNDEVLSIVQTDIALGRKVKK